MQKELQRAAAKLGYELCEYDYKNITTNDTCFWLLTMGKYEAALKAWFE